MLNPIVRSTAKILRRNYKMKIRNETASIATAKLRRLLHGTSQSHEQVNITNTGTSCLICGRLIFKVLSYIFDLFVILIAETFGIP